MKSVITISMCLVMTLVLNFVFGGIAYADLNDGLVAYYPFDGDANDESGNGNHGTVLGPTLITDMCGKEDGAYSFGELKHIKINHNEKINFGSGDVFTISAFVKPEKGDTYLCNENGQSCTHYGAIVVKSPISGFYNYGLYYDRKYKKFMGGYHYMHHAVYGADGVDEDKWYHLVLIYQNCSWKLYVNTDLVDTSSNHCITTSQGALEIGRKGDSNNNTDFFRGIIDDIRIYNRVLSETEIKELSDGKCNTECNEEDSGSIDITGKSGPCGGKQTIPVRIQDAPATANSIGFDVAFDSGVLIYTGFARGELAVS
ncbi:MAG: LamG domain-containing protein, partial [Desulfobacterales bacterium]|nr:LamG domain-containing protein [Desulfobacterales bacterium]